jgi:hypothetical protein
MKKREQLSFTKVRPPRLPSIMHWKPTTRRTSDSPAASASDASTRRPLELVTDEPTDEPAIEATETDSEENRRRLLSWPIVTPREDPPGHTIGLREV